LWNAYKIIFGKPEEKIPLVRPRHIRADNIKLDLRNRLGGCEVDSAKSGHGPVADS
jgi:hypothetical protein